MKKITLKNKGNLDQYECFNENGKSILLSGDGGAVGPMESILMSLAGCSTIDVVMILKKMRQKLDNIEVEVSGSRQKEIPRIYTDIQMHFRCYGKLKDKKVEKAISLSLKKYCSVALMLSQTANITATFEVIS